LLQREERIAVDVVVLRPEVVAFARGQFQRHARFKDPPYLWLSPSSSAMRRSWLYFATRSERDAEPVLICPEPVATARSAMKATSLAPERCEMTAAQPARCAVATQSSVSVNVPI